MTCIQLSSQMDPKKSDMPVCNHKFFNTPLQNSVLHQQPSLCQLQIPYTVNVKSKTKDSKEDNDIEDMMQ